MEKPVSMPESEMILLLTGPFSPPREPFTPVQASDEIVSLFCVLHNGIEVAMPIIRNQFFKEDVDFDHPTGEGLARVTQGLVEVTNFLKGDKISKLAEKRFALFLRHMA